MSIELRILSGPQRGACVPISPYEVLRVGQDKRCDVVLEDPAFSRQVWHLVCTSHDWLMLPRGSADTTSQARRLGEVVECNGLRITVCERDAYWSLQLGDDAIKVTADPATKATDEGSEHPQRIKNRRISGTQTARPRSAVSRVRRQLMTDASGSTTSAASVDGDGRRRLRWPRRPRLVALGTLALASYSISLAITPPRSDDKALQVQTVAPLGTDAGSTPAAVSDSGSVTLTAKEFSASATAVSAALEAAAPASSPLANKPGLNELQARFTDQLKTAGLWGSLKADFGDSQWTLEAHLGPKDERHLGRVIAAFWQEHTPSVSIRATVKSIEELLPFRVQEVHGGATASVVTSDGQRLYVGDSLSGYRLTRVDEHSVTFTGKRKIEVPL